MANIVSRIITPGSATVSYQGQVKTFMAGSDEYDKVVAFLKAGDEDGLIDFLVNFKKKVESASKDFRVIDDVVFIRMPDGSEESLPKLLGERLIQFADEGLPYQPIINFWNRLAQNPSYSAVQRLFECLEHNNHPLNPDGRFLAWKKVKADYKDIYSGKFDNTPGKSPSVPRNKVDEDMDRTCSHGLHVASYDYACNHYGSSSGGDVLLEVLVDPADVVAIPRDYNNQKMRVCKYEVVQVVQEETKVSLYGYKPPVDDEDWDEDDDGDCDCDSCRGSDDDSDYDDDDGY